MLNLSQPGSIGTPSGAYSSQPLAAFSASPEQLLCAAFNFALFIIRFIKNPVRVTMERNSFYVVRGLSRLLYSCSTAETANTYSPVIPGSSRARDDY